MLFAPKYIKEAHQIAKNVQRLLHYKRDVLRPEDHDRIVAVNGRLADAARQRDPAGVERLTAELDAEIGKFIPPHKHHAITENVETFLVAIVIALGIRAYFLQPFKIPTGSMQPTLNGVIPIRDDQPFPNPAQRAWETVWNGRSYVHQVADRDDQIVNLTEKPFLWFSTSTVVSMASGKTFKVPCSKGPAGNDLGLYPGREFKAGETIVNAHVDTGDQVFVDKVTYHFRAPQRGDVFVFTTAGIAGIRDDPRSGGNTQFYIKRLSALPGDNVRIDPPNLYINGALADTFGNRRVMSSKNGYRGYGNGPLLLQNPDQSFDLPEKSYLALGDNSYNSSDSRYWGPVPEKDLVGRGLFVYWPFGQHFGLVR